jgi:uncharacterized C2H2 Zn-finger protein
MGKIKKPKLISVEEEFRKKGLFTPVKIDPDWYEKQLEAKRKAEEKTRKEEGDRSRIIKCPSCKSTSKDHIEKRDDNGIYGPGYSSWIIDEYFVCKKCGTMFKDMEKYRKNESR